MSRIEDRTMKKFLAAAAIAFALTAEAGATRPAQAEKASQAESRGMPSGTAGEAARQARPGKAEPGI